MWIPKMCDIKSVHGPHFELWAKMWFLMQKYGLKLKVLNVSCPCNSFFMTILMKRVFPQDGQILIHGLRLGWSEKRVKSFYSIVRCASTSLIILWLIHVNFGCISFSVIMKVFVIFWVFNLRRLTALSWCLWLEHMFYYFNCRWQHQVTKGGYSNLHVAT